MGGERRRKGKLFNTRRAISLHVALAVLTVAALSGIIIPPNTRAGGISLSAGNVTLTLSDYGVITNEVSWNMLSQTHIVYDSYLTIHHDAYPTGGGSTEVASGYGVGGGDFTVDETNIYLQSGTIQETYSSFTQTGVTGVSDDLRIFQTAYSRENEDWAIILWRIENIYGQDIVDLRVGMNFRTRIGDSPGNDVDHWNAADSVYYIEDQTSGNVIMGLASADDSIPINHYYGNPAGVVGAVDPSDEKSLHQSLTVRKVHGSADEITCMAGWEIATLLDGTTASLPLVISFGTSYLEVQSATTKARDFLAFQSADLQITEIQDSVSGGNIKVEVYNSGEYPVSTSDVYLSPDGSIQWDAGGWSKTPILPGEHVFYTLGLGEAFQSTEGAEIGLLYSGDLPLDLVSFGQLGHAPDPVTDQSIARFWNGTDYSNEWVRDLTPTFGAQNDCMGMVDPPPIALKEVFFNADSPNERFIELYYLGNGSLSTGGWTLVVDSDYILPPVTLNATMRYFVLRGRDFPSGFDMDDGTINGDNVYLYDGLGRLADMVGWSSAHSKGLSLARIAYLKFNGFNEASSTQAGWRFDRVPTSEIVNIGPNQSETVDPGQTAEFRISVNNQGSSPDTFDISFVSSLGWPTEITDILGVPIVDNDGDALPDTDVLLVGESINLNVQVSAPPDPQDGNYNTLYVTATSSLDADVLDTVTLLTVAAVPPYVVVNKTAYPDTIWLESVSANPRETTITLNVTGAGTPLTQSLPQDAVLVIDNSGSTRVSDPSNLRMSGARTYVDRLTVPDRVATVEFNESAVLVNGRHLSSDYIAVKADIDSLNSSGDGGTYIAEGLRVGLDEMIGYRMSSHLHIIILFTDGKDLIMHELIQQAYRAADNGVIVFTIGLTNASNFYLQQVADITGGEFYPAVTPEALEGVYLAIHRKVSSLAAKKISDPIEPNPLIRDALPPYIHFVPGSFRDQDSNPKPPDNITANPDGGYFLDWDVERLFINQSFVVKYEATSSRGGIVPVGIHPHSRVNYTKWDNSTESVPFPEVLINVLVLPSVNPPALSIETDQNNVTLLWTVPGDNISHYIIYRSPDQRTFSFTSPLANTGMHSDGGVIPTRTTWNDTGAASLSPREYYYVVRAVDKFGSMSVTSNTVGKWTKHFDSGLSTFSLPLEPMVGQDIEWYASSIPNTIYMDWMDDSDHWMRHWKGGPVTRGPLMIGEGFQIYLSAASNYTFVGSPASMIRFQEGLGNPLDFRRGLTAFAIQDDVKIYWKPVAGASGYNVYRSDNRLGLHGNNMTILATVGASTTSWWDYGAIAQAANWFYMIVTIDDEWKEGSSTYSVGVLSVEFDVGHTFMGLPLKPIGIWTLDYYCERMPTVVGMAYLSDEVWRFHATEMPAGVFDPFMEQSEGYQVSVDGMATIFTFVGF